MDPAEPTRTARDPGFLDDAVAIEAEISQLTWQVLDGQASLEDRQRLAQLVRAQHQRRG
jgi:hypothetical protein